MNMRPTAREIRDKTRVVIVDDHAVQRRGLSQILQAEHDIVVLGETGDCADMWPLFSEHVPHVAILSQDMRGVDMPGLLHRMAGAAPDTRAIVYASEHGDDFRLAMRAGARAYVLKSWDHRELLASVRMLRAGRTYIHAEQMPLLLPTAPASRLHRQQTERRRLDSLSKREREVLGCLLKGCSCKEMVEACGVTVQTIDTYRRRIFAKLGVCTKHELIKFGLRHNLGGPTSGRH